MGSEILVTIADIHGRSESLPVSSTTTVKELSELSSALFGTENIRLLKDGRPLDPTLQLETAGVQNGDLLVAHSGRVAAAAPPASAPASAAAGGGLDFSNLLAGAGAASGGPSSSGGLDFSNFLGQSALTTRNNNHGPLYYEGMNFDECWEQNPTPEHIVSLLQSKEHLLKELNYHNPTLAGKIRGQPYEAAVKIWREELVKTGIQSAMSRTSTFHKENEMKRRLRENPNDEEVRTAIVDF